MYDIHKALHCIGKDQPFFIQPKQTKAPKQKEKKPPLDKKKESVVISTNSKKTKLYGKLLNLSSEGRETLRIPDNKNIMTGVG